MLKDCLKLIMVEKNKLDPELFLEAVEKIVCVEGIKFLKNQLKIAQYNKIGLEYQQIFSQYNQEPSFDEICKLVLNFIEQIKKNSKEYLTLLPSEIQVVIFAINDRILLMPTEKKSISNEFLLKALRSTRDIVLSNNLNDKNPISLLTNVLVAKSLNDNSGQLIAHLEEFTN